MKEEKTPPSKEVLEEERTRTIRDKFKTEIAEMLALDLFNGMGDYMVQNEGIIDYLDVVDCSIAIIKSLIQQQCALAHSSESPEVAAESNARWGVSLLEIIEKIKTDEEAAKIE